MANNSTDTVELEVFGPRVDHLEVVSSRKASAAVVVDLDQLRDSEMSRCFPVNRPHSKRRRKSNTKSCGSLSSLASSFKSKSKHKSNQNSEPSVSYQNDESVRVIDDHLHLPVTCSEENFVLTTGNTPSDDQNVTMNLHHNNHKGKPNHFFSSACLNQQQSSPSSDGGGGGNGGLGTTGGAGSRFRTSIFSVLGKLGMWHKQQQNTLNSNYHGDVGPPSATSNSSFFRTVYICGSCLCPFYDCGVCVCVMWEIHFEFMVLVLIVV